MLFRSESAEAARSNPLDGMIRSEQAGELYKALEQLKPVDRATLIAFYIRGRSLKQMSREFETPVGTIKRRLHVARIRLKRQMDRAAGVGAEASGEMKVRKPRRERELACV